MILITKTDVRQYRQYALQGNQDNFDGIVREVQENELTDLLGAGLIYDFFNYLETNWNTQAGSFTRTNDYEFRADNLDLSLWVGYALKINSNTFVIIESATYTAPNTIIKVKGYKLPETISTVEYKQENNYIRLLNGDTYTCSSNTVKYNGLRAYMVWVFLAIYTSEGNVKHTDVGSISIMPERGEIPKSKGAARTNYLQNSMREYNRICSYLDNNEDIFPLWESKNKENLTNLQMIII